MENLRVVMVLHVNVTNNEREEHHHKTGKLIVQVIK